MSTPPIPDAARAARCAQCGTAIPPTAVSCHACHALVHAERLKALADTARGAAAAGDVSRELEAWREALECLPPESSQFRTIAGRVQTLSRGLSDPDQAPAPPPARAAATTATSGMSGRAATWTGAIGAAVLFVVTKGKLLVAGLGQSTTLFSMLAAVGVYWTIWGWAFAIGVVLSIYVHEMGHVAAMRRFGLAPTAPMFIPGFGAVVRARRHAANPREDARIGLGGPIWGLGAAAACFLIYRATGQPYWAALTQTGAMINLFNLTPVWGLDGDHAFKPLTPVERWAATAVIAGMFYATGEGLLVLVGVFAAVQAFRKAPHAEGDRVALIQFAGLVVALALLMKMPAPPQP